MFPDTTNNQLLLQASRLAGLLGAVITVGLYAVLLFFNPYSSQEIVNDAFGIGAVMTALAGLAIWASLRLKPIPLLFIFLGSFFPAGLYMLGTSGIFRWIGVSNLFYLLAGLGMAFALRSVGPED